MYSNLRQQNKKSELFLNKKGAQAPFLILLMTLIDFIDLVNNQLIPNFIYFFIVSEPFISDQYKLISLSV
jgi:hypothetical protein